MPANGKLIELARIARGLQQEELAARVGVSQSKISKYEHDHIQVSDGDLKKVASALGYPVKFFLRTDEVHGFGTVCLYHRKRKSLTQPELSRIHAKINILRMHVAPLVRGALIETPYSLPYMDIDEIDGGPQEIARRTRGAWGVPLGPVKNMLNLIEDAGGIVVGCSFGTKLLDAVSHCPKGHPPFVFINTDVTAGDRLRFTLAHELGHMVMKNHASPDPELEANRFASEFLMPANEIKRDLVNLTIERAAALKAHWKVSMQAIIEWAKALGAITLGRHRSLRMAINERNYRVVEPIPIPAETPTTFPDLLRMHTNELGFSTKQVCDLMTIHEDEYQATFGVGPHSPSLRIVG